MATIINNPPSNQDTGSSDGGGGMMGILVGVILVVVVIFLFVSYGLPAMRGGQSQNINDGNSGTGGPTINVPDKIDVNIKK